MPDSCYPLPLTILEEKFKASKGFKWNSGKSQRLGGWGGTGTDSNAAETGSALDVLGGLWYKSSSRGKIMRVLNTWKVINLEGDEREKKRRALERKR